MGQRWFLTTAEYRQNFNNYVDQMLLAGKRVVVEFVPEGRSLDQNDMIQALYKQVAEQKQDETVVDITRHCKLHYGVPILRSADNSVGQKFRAMYDRVVKPHDYSTKLEVMDYLPVTRLFNKKQASEYIDTIIREYSSQGLCMTHPSEEAA